MLVGDLQRVIEYPKLGFAIEQDVPEDVHGAYESLLADGFDSRSSDPDLPPPGGLCAIHQPNLFPG